MRSEDEILTQITYYMGFSDAMSVVSNAGLLDAHLGNIAHENEKKLHLLRWVMDFRKEPELDDEPIDSSEK